MRKCLTTVVFGLSLLAMSIAQAHDFSSLDLEPCINGGVSASGLYPSQGLEDRHGTFNESDLERTPNGGVPSSGRFPNQKMEEASNKAS